ncbi:MAG: sensor histidine kinase [Chloroflexota bacterium]
MERPLPFALRTEIRTYKVASIVFLALLLGHNLFNIEPPLSTPEMLAYIGLTLALIVTQSLHFVVPVGSETLTRALPWMALNAALVFGIAFLLRGQAILYFYLIVFDGYAGLRFISKGYRWPVGYAAGVAALSGLVYARFGLLPSWWGILPIFALVTFVAEFFIIQWEQRQKMDDVLAELSQAHRQLQDHTVQAESLAIAQERNRLAHEIHDTLGHTLTTLNVQLGLLAHLPPEMNAARWKAIENAQNLVTTGLTDVRRAVKALRPEALETFSLPEAITELARNFQETAQIEVDCQFCGTERTIPPRLALPLYRIAQEALTNVRRHARDATGVALEFNQSQDWIELRVSNAPPKSSPIKPPEPTEDLDTLIARGHGLRGMSERAAALGGDFQAGPTQTGGFEVKVRLKTED